MRKDNIYLKIWDKKCNFVDYFCEMNREMSVELILNVL